MLPTLLHFDYEDILDQAVTAVLGERLFDAPGFWAVAIVLEHQALVLRVSDDSDQLILTLEDEPATQGQWEAIDTMADVVGSRLGWCWEGRSYTGYLDMFLLSFDVLEPQFCFVAVAAQVEIKRLTRLG